MFKVERTIIEKILKHSWLIAFAVITLLSAVIRYYGRTFVSGDMDYFFLPWYDQMKATGFKGLSEPLGDYNILYQEIMLLLTLLPFKPLYLVKSVSILFDYLLALLAAMGVCSLKKEKYNSLDFLFAYFIVLFLPTVVLNSAFWGQCDGIYTFFILLVVFLSYGKRYRSAFLFLGIAFAFKVQTVFIVPFILYLYILKKDFSLLNFLWSVLSFWACGIPAYIAGRGIFGTFEAYVSQVEASGAMWFNFPSFWRMIGGDPARLSTYAVALTIALLGMGLLLLNKKKAVLSGKEEYFQCAVLTVWTCTLFLSNMRDRYNYPLDILLIVLCFINVKFTPFGIVSILLSMKGYCIYLYTELGESLTYFDSAAMFVAWMVFTYGFFTKKKDFRVSRVQADE